MSVSVYSAVMAVLWFTVAVFIGNYTLHRASRYGLFFIAAILILSVLRIFLPLDFDHSFVIRSLGFYPIVQEFVRTALIGRVSVGSCLIICWIAVSCIRLALLLRKLLLRRKFQKVCIWEAGQELLDLLWEVSREAGYNGPSTLTVSPKATSAYQTGLIHPCIILPYDIDQFSKTDITNMIRHELCHFLGHDLWIKMGLQVMACVLWWNPAVGVLSRNVEQMLELRCDRRACKHLTDLEQVSYLDTLIRLLSSGRHKFSRLSIDYLGNGNEAEVIQRFQMLLQEKERPSSKIKSVAGCLLCVALFLASYCVIWQPWIPIPDITESSIEDKVSTGASTETNYIICESDGTLRFYCNGTYWGIIPQNSLDSVPFSDFPIISENNMEEFFNEKDK